nr:hypothetical protein [Candidatus Vallotia cooleyia]
MLKQFLELTNCYLLSEGSSYRMAVIQIKNGYVSRAKCVMFGTWSVYGSIRIRSSLGRR